MNTQKSWSDTFAQDLKREGSLLAHYTGCLVQNWRFVQQLLIYTGRVPCAMLEAGAGTGYIAAYLSGLGHNVAALDIDVGFLAKTKEYLHAGFTVHKQDISRKLDFDHKRFDLIYNIGVMEHFEDKELFEILQNFAALTGRFIFSVPNFKIAYSFGNERYLSVARWKRILADSGWSVEKVFRYNKYSHFRNYLTGFICAKINSGSYRRGIR